MAPPVDGSERMESIMVGPSGTTGKGLDGIVGAFFVWAQQGPRMK